MLNTHTAGGVVVHTQTQKIVIVEQLNQIWSLPKGHIDPGETALQAAIREIKEETGISELTYIQKLGEYNRYKIAKGGGDDTSEFKTMTFYLFNTSQATLQPEDEENPQALWVDKEEVVNHLSHYKDKEFFQSIINQIG